MELPVTHVELAPDYGGALFRMGLGMADVDTFRHAISSELQSDLTAWYRVYDDDVVMTPETATEWRAEAARLARRLQIELGSRYEVSVSATL